MQLGQREKSGGLVIRHLQMLAGYTNTGLRVLAEISDKQPTLNERIQVSKEKSRAASFIWLSLC